MSCQYRRNKTSEVGNRTNSLKSFMSRMAVTVHIGHCDLDMMKQTQINVILFLYCMWVILQRHKCCSTCSVMW